MRKSLTLQTVVLSAVFLFLFLLVVGCGKQTNMETQISGSWQRSDSNGTVDINLAKEPRSLVVDGRSYKATVEKTEKGSFTTLVKVETDTGQTEVWSLRQMWNDNGSTFNLDFKRNGTQEILVPAGRS